MVKPVPEDPPLCLASPWVWTLTFHWLWASRPPLPPLKGGHPIPQVNKYQLIQQLSAFSCVLKSKKNLSRLLKKIQPLKGSTHSFESLIFLTQVNFLTLFCNYFYFGIYFIFEKAAAKSHFPRRRAHRLLFTIHTQLRHSCFNSCRRTKNFVKEKDEFSPFQPARILLPPTEPTHRCYRG